MAKTFKELTELKGIFADSREHWLYLERHYFEVQNGTVKTYLWLAVTLLGAQLYAFDSYLHPLVGWNLQILPWWIWFAFVASVALSLAALLIGISCLSSLLLGQVNHDDAYLSAQDQCKQIYDSNQSTEERIKVLRGFCQHFDKLHGNQVEMIKAKTARMRVQCVCILFSVLSLLGFFLMLFLGG